MFIYLLYLHQQLLALFNQQIITFKIQRKNMSQHLKEYTF